MWQTYLRPTSLVEALKLLQHYDRRARIIAGGTDVLVEMQRGIKLAETLIDISTLNELKYIRNEDNYLAIGALATHNDVIRSALCREYALPLVQACSEIGAPQIRTRATVVGNIVTASPANDTITALTALNARVVLSGSDGERIIPLHKFYQGVRSTVVAADEIVREVQIPRLTHQQRGLFLKLGLRRAQAIAVINAAFVLTCVDDIVQKACIVLGCVAPTIVHASEAENFLVGKKLTVAVCDEAGQKALQTITPIDDVRASANYRRHTVSSLVSHGLLRIATETETDNWMAQTVTLETPLSHSLPTPEVNFTGVIETSVNGKQYAIANAQYKTLLQMLREDIGLTGTKEGCAEGECGACTVWLNGQAVMACLVPAVQAHRTSITTIEGLAFECGPHPLQQAFIDHGAVQCGFCIPGMLMAGAKLLDEYPEPDNEQVRTALCGNICRCTGYQKIVDAVISVGGSATCQNESALL